MKKLLILLLILLTACSNTVVKRKTVDELASLLKGSNAEVFASEVAAAYNIFPISYADSNGDGYGDFRGIIDHLDVLNDGNPATSTDLGITAIWLNPIHPSKTYHKYDVMDYYAVDPQFGTMEDFKALVAACKQRGIKLILDMVFNHTAIDNPWFQEAISGNKKYLDYYRIEKKLTNAQYPDKTNWYFTNSLAYYASFWDKMPELNAQSENVRTELRNILKFWMDLGVDGFRYDAAPRIYYINEYPVGTPTMELNKQFWMEMKQYVKSVNPDIFLLAEVWLPSNQAAAFAPGFDAMFNFDLATGILNTIKQGYQSDFVQTYLNGKKNFTSRNENYIDATFITNHDQNRVMSEFQGDLAKARLAANLLFTLPGIPFIYYGEELGMFGAKPDEQIREPYRWTNLDAIPNALWEAWQLNLTTPTYTTQKDDPNSMFSLYRKLVQMRDANDTLRFGDIEALVLATPNPKLLGFTRHYEGKKLTIIHNLDKNPQEVTLTSGKTVLFENNGATLKGNTVTLPGYSSIIVED
jgi:alpha-amylase